jgi:hypothetical protein
MTGQARSSLSRRCPAIVTMGVLAVAVLGLACQLGDRASEAPTAPSTRTVTPVAPGAAVRTDTSAVSTVAALGTAFASRAGAPGNATTIEVAAPGPTPTVAPGTPASASPPSASASPAALRTVLDERFADNGRGWPENQELTARVADGAYRLFARRPGQFVAVAAPLNEPLRDVIVTAVFRKIGGPAGGGYGLIVGDQGLGPRDGINQQGLFVVVEVGDKGEFGVWRRAGDRWIDLIGWTGTEAMHPGGEQNQVMAQVLGPELRFSVNGVELARVKDATVSEGRVGIFVGGDFNQVAVDRFTIQVPE